MKQEDFIKDEFYQALNFWSDEFDVEIKNLESETPEIVSGNIVCKSIFFSDIQYYFYFVFNPTTEDLKVCYGPEAEHETEVTPEFLYYDMWQRAVRGIKK